MSNIHDIRNNVFFKVIYKEWEEIRAEIAPCDILIAHYPQMVCFEGKQKIGLYRFGKEGKLFVSHIINQPITWERLAYIFRHAFLTVECPSTFTGVEARTPDAAKSALGMRYIDGYNYYMLQCE